jgi:hypothetical protein
MRAALAPPCIAAELRRGQSDTDGLVASLGPGPVAGGKPGLPGDMASKGARPHRGPGLGPRIYFSLPMPSIFKMYFS